MSSSENNFSAALSAWKDINLAELQKTLDTQGIEIVENQKESVVGRKALADRTKEFKKIPDEDKLSAWKSLLKAYQTEIDNLTKRSKTSENAFLSLYKKLAEAPDPYPLLDVAVEQTIKASQTSLLESQLEKLKEENSALNQKLQELSSVDASKKKLETKVQQLESRMEDMITEKVSQKENEMHATYDEKLRNYEDREKDLIRQLSLSQTQLRDLRTSNESNQAKLLDQSERQDQETLGKLAELDMILAELERANNRVAATERRNELLRAEMEAVRSGSDVQNRVAPLEQQISELTNESERLARVLEVQKTASADAERSLKKNIEEKDKELSSRVSEVDNLRRKLELYADYDEIKRELDIMKYVEFGGMEDNESSETVGINSLGLALPSPNPSTSTSQQQQNSLETLLATKNKRIMEELTKLRVANSDLESRMDELTEELRLTKVELEEKRTLNEKLELDLLQLEMHKPRANGNNAASPTDTLQDTLGLPDLGLGNVKANSDSSRSTPIPFAPSADTSILPIVTSQRDRFRQRNAELEEELRKQFQTLSELRSEVKTLQTDNLKLYEKVRYMQSYREDAQAQLNPLPAARQDDLSKYHARYEEAMNPFEAFRGREAARAFQALNPIEKAVLSLTRAILGNRRARNAFVFYALALHVLVMFTTFECTASSDSSIVRTQPHPN
ncbi:golgi membrane [Pyrrhoderma noxium]|uniref:Protein CASP n=1 Tax=Pyrrhoderma noxium TaxID=2282107 RepID=A0A286UGR7_9AGAM|nr:golgi membrane [Pyrrhoderma noxium]